MLTKLREKKLSYLFDILDANKNELLQPDDFALVAEKMSDILGYDQHSKQRLKLKLKALRLFVQLLIDMNKEDTSINKEEWLKLFGSESPMPAKMASSYINRTAGYIFQLFDQNEDRVITKNEYLDMFRVYDIDLSYSAIGFEKLDENKDNLITLEEMTNAFKDFLMSSKPDAPGNWIFGNWEKDSEPLMK